MTRLLRILLAIACSAFLLSGVLHGEDSKKATPAEIEKLIKQLGSDDFDKREAASKTLEAIGEPALGALRRAATKSDDAELRRRAEKLVEALEPYRELCCFKGHTDGAVSGAFSPDGKRVLSAARDKSLLLWEAETGKEVRRFPDAGEISFGVAFSPDGKQVMSGGRDNTVLLWDAETGKELRRFEGHTDGINAVTFSPDGKRALSTSGDHTLRLWDVPTGKALRRFTGHTSSVEKGVFSPDGTRALSSSWDGTMRLWDVETGKELRCIKVGDAVLGIAISPDGKEALGVVGYGVSAMLLWDLKSGKELRHFKGHKNTIGGLAFCPDGKRAVSGGYDKTVRVWDTTTGKELHCFTGHTERINSVAVSLDGRVALSASDDATVRLWQLSPKPASAKRAGGPKKK